ncbi:MAG: hypothetical protein Q7Q73_12895 [Verrucomicrobiota bacterium JB024]|nr:hypothetical protein [Verrucomicrobiota bacterium JB024]
MPAFFPRLPHFLLAATLWLGAALGVQAATDNFAQNTRPATLEEIPGTWEMTFQRFAHPVENDPQLTARYQIFDFQPDGVFKLITATRRVSDEDRKLFLNIMPANTHWELLQDGLLVIRRSELDADGIQVFSVTQDFQDELVSGSPALKKGDLVLIYQDKIGTPYLRRYLRPLPPLP